MKFIQLLIITLASASIGKGQNKQEIIKNIRLEFQKINTDKNLKTTTIDAEEFMENATDGGGELTNEEYKRLFFFQSRYSLRMQCPQGRNPNWTASDFELKNTLLSFFILLPELQSSLPYIFNFRFPPKQIVPFLIFTRNSTFVNSEWAIMMLSFPSLRLPIR